MDYLGNKYVIVLMNGSRDVQMRGVGGVTPPNVNETTQKLVMKQGH